MRQICPIIINFLCHATRYGFQIIRGRWTLLYLLWGILLHEGDVLIDIDGQEFFYQSFLKVCFLLFLPKNFIWFTIIKSNAKSPLMDFLWYLKNQVLDSGHRSWSSLTKSQQFQENTLLKSPQYWKYNTQKSLVISQQSRLSPWF